MSKIQGKPFIEELVNSLSADLRKELLDLVNGSDKTPEFRSLVNKDHLVTGSDKNKVQYIVLETFCKTYTGYLVYNNSYCILIAFNNNTQALQLVNVDLVKNNCRVIKQPVDILELRMYLRDPTASTTIGEIDSGDEPENKVITSDGNGGAYWGSKVNYLVLTGESGTLTDEQLAVAQLDSAVAQLGDNGQMYYKNSQSNYYIIFKATARVAGNDTIVEKVTINVSDKTWSYSYDVVAAGESFTPTYDDALSDASTNAVQNKVVTEALEQKANVDGNYPTMTVGVADQLSPYDDESGDDQDEPFNFQATGTGNGSQPDFATGSIALMKEKRGNTVVVNQLSKWKTDGTWYGLTLTNNQDGSCSLSGTASPDAFGQVIIGGGVEFKRDGSKKYLIACFGNGNFTYGINGYGAEHSEPYIFDVSGDAEPWVGGITLNMEQGDTVNLTRLQGYVIDLTQWFNGDIPQDLLDHPENFLRYYQGSLAYNTGELVNANSRYLKAIGRNQWDEDASLNYVYNSDGTGYSADGYLSSRNITKVIPNATYYIKTSYYGSDNVQILYFDKDNNCIGYFNTNGLFTIPSNVCGIKFTVRYESGSISAYKNDITVSLYYEGESGYDQYYPYEVLTNNDTGTETLRSAGSVADSKAPDGTITRRIGVVDLGSLEWIKNDYNSFISTGLEALIQAPSGSGVKANLTCSKYINDTANNAAYSHTNDKAIAYSSYYKLAVYDSALASGDAAAFKTAMSGVYLFYELATPTTEQGTPYSENIVIDDFGSMDFSGTSGVPQGNLIFYPVDYKAFIDTLYDYTEGTPSNIALKSDLAVVNEKIGAKLPECPTTTDGTYVLKATVADGEVVYAWILEV